MLTGPSCKDCVYSRDVDGEKPGFLLSRVDSTPGPTPFPRLQMYKHTVPRHVALDLN